jgi:hypothetical protein
LFFRKSSDRRIKIKSEKNKVSISKKEKKITALERAENTEITYNLNITKSNFLNLK